MRRLKMKLVYHLQTSSPAVRRSQEAQSEPSWYGWGVQSGEPAFVPLCGISRSEASSNNPVKYVDPDGRETTVIITHSNEWWEKLFGGSHVAIHMSKPKNEEPTLYDPSGSYKTTDEFGAKYRPSSGVFWSEPESDLDKYIKYETRNGQTVNIYKINTTPEQEDELIRSAFKYGDGNGFDCANNVSSVLADVIGFKKTLTPGGVEKQLEKMVKDGSVMKYTLKAGAMK